MQNSLERSNNLSENSLLSQKYLAEDQVLLTEQITQSFYLSRSQLQTSFFFSKPERSLLSKQICLKRTHTQLLSARSGLGAGRRYLPYTRKVLVVDGVCLELKLLGHNLKRTHHSMQDEHHPAYTQMLQDRVAIRCKYKSMVVVCKSAKHDVGTTPKARISLH